MPKKKVGKSTAIITTLLLMFCGFIAYTTYTAYVFSKDMQTLYQTHVKEQPIESFRKNLTDTTKSTVRIADIEALKVAPNVETPALKETIGAIYIPDVGLQIPIFNGEDAQQLSQGAVKLATSGTLNNSDVILGSNTLNNSKTLFTPLLSANKGMDIYVTDKQTITHYQVEKVVKAKPTRKDIELAQNDSTMRLVTLFEEDGEQYLCVVYAKFIYKDEFNAENLGQLYDAFMY